MTSPLRRSIVVSVCALACAAVAAAALQSPAEYVRSTDQNSDGQPDIWRTYDRQGRLSHVAVDTNFDGRADVEEYYDRGALVRRESDRDFNDRVDLIQDFDPVTREPLRSVVDVDFDGRADLLVLFRDGQPVYSKWASPATTVAAVSSTPRAAKARRAPTDHLAPLLDPFAADLSVRAVHVLVDAGTGAGLTTSGGLPASWGDLASPLPSSTPIPGSRVSRPASATVVPYSPRGPPRSSPLT
jgi:hypothetical protein